MKVFIFWTTCSLIFIYSASGQNEYNKIPRFGGGSCALAGICCAGRDSSCVVQNSEPNSMEDPRNNIPCYCDHACLVIGDCCSDFKQACAVQDCQVSGWGVWSGCSAECGRGVMTRTRTVLVEPKNGGQPCSLLVQKRACRGTHCITSRFQYSRSNTDDMAIILPVEFNRKRKMNKTSDITWNLRLRYPKNPAKERSNPYCVEFEVARVTKTCKTLGNFANLREGTHVCVVCEGAAQMLGLDEWKCAGTGSSHGQSSRFSSLREPTCHGKWKHVQSNATCNWKNHYICEQLIRSKFHVVSTYQSF